MIAPSIELHHGDCLELMARIPDGSIDLVACDLPYAQTACAWDTVIPFAPLWAHYKRVIKPNGAIVLNAAEPFASHLRMSNISWFKYDWVWEKSTPTNFNSANTQPLRSHEMVCAFSGGTVAPGSQRNMPYNPQGTRPCHKMNRRSKRGETTGERPNQSDCYIQTKENFPRSVVRFPNQTGLHPTQKPVALFEYLIRTYTNEGETVLDNCMGSGTTGIACLNTGRAFIGIELSAAYIEIAKARIAAAQLSAANKELDFGPDALV